MLNIDEFTVAVSPLDIYFNNTHLSRGTGFFWKKDEETYLITNWHNVSGKNPFTKKHISPHASEPNQIKFDLFRNKDINQRVTATIGLFQNGKPIWLEHPKLGSDVDVVCIKVKSQEYMPLAINELISSEITVKVGLDVFILGFPMGIDTQRLPIWKRGSVASEPELDVDNLPMFYVDTATASGMSGAPVIRRATSGEMDDGSFVLSGGVMSRFVGVYSGRLAPKDRSEAQIGMIWKARVISEIIEGAVYGSTV